MCFLFLCENLEQFLSQNDLPEVNESKVLGIFPIVFSQIGIYTFIAANASMRFLEIRRSMAAHVGALDIPASACRPDTEARVEVLDAFVSYQLDSHDCSCGIRLALLKTHH